MHKRRDLKLTAPLTKHSPPERPGAKASLASPMTLAAFPMYDFEEIRWATDALWAAISARLRDQGIQAPASLERARPLHAIWTDPDLLLAQTCGYPLVTSLAGRVALVATPRYTAPGCTGAYYRSAVVVRVNDMAASLADLRGRRCAVNDAASNSGMNLLRVAIAQLARGAAHFFSDVVMTGGHEASVQAVAVGQADVAAIDCVTWAQLQRLRPDRTRELRVLAWTAASAGLPLITSLRTDAASRSALIDALDSVVSDRALAPIRGTLLLDGFALLEPSDYESILDLERQAQATDYPVMR